MPSSDTINSQLSHISYLAIYVSGAAHGLSSILQMLLSFPSFVKSSEETETLLRSAVDFMLSLEQDNYNFPPAMDEVTSKRPEGEELVHWCHGAAGKFYFMAHAYLIWWQTTLLLHYCISK